MTKKLAPRAQMSVGLPLDRDQRGFVWSPVRNGGGPWRVALLVGDEELWGPERWSPSCGHYNIVIIIELVGRSKIGNFGQEATRRWEVGKEEVIRLEVAVDDT